MIRVGIECESIEGESWGIGRLTLKLLEELAKDPSIDSEFKFILYFKSEIPSHKVLDNPIFEKKLIKFPLINSFSLYYFILLPIKLWFEKLDVMYFPNYMLPHLFRGKSIVHFTSDVIYEMKSPAQKLKYRLAYRVFSTRAARHASIVMTMSEASKNQLNELMGIPRDRITVNYLGVDLGKPEPNSKYEEENYILYLGQAFPRRHAKETMMAFESIAKDIQDLKLYVIGYDLYRPPILAKLAEDINSRLGREAITYKPRVESVLELYAHAKLTIYVSDMEAFGLPPLEALALGSIPVVADNDLTHEEMGDNAFFVKKLHDIDALEATIRDGLSNTQKRDQIRAAANGIVSKFTWSSHKERLVKMFEKLASK